MSQLTERPLKEQINKFKKNKEIENEMIKNLYNSLLPHHKNLQLDILDREKIFSSDVGSQEDVEKIIIPFQIFKIVLKDFFNIIATGHKVWNNYYNHLKGIEYFVKFENDYKEHWYKNPNSVIKAVSKFVEEETTRRDIVGKEEKIYQSGLETIKLLNSSANCFFVVKTYSKFEPSNKPTSLVQIIYPNEFSFVMSINPAEYVKDKGVPVDLKICSIDVSKLNFEKLVETLSKI